MEATVNSGCHQGLFALYKVLEAQIQCQCLYTESLHLKSRIIGLSGKSRVDVRIRSALTGTQRTCHAFNHLACSKASKNSALTQRFPPPLTFCDL